MDNDRPLSVAELDDEYALALGRMISEAGEVEYQVRRLIWVLLRIEDLQVASAATDSLSFNTAIRTASQLAKATLGASDEVSSLLKRADKAMEQRNAMVHALWVTGEGDQRHRIGIKGLRSEQIAHTDIEALTTELFEIAHLFFRRTLRLMDELDVDI